MKLFVDHIVISVKDLSKSIKFYEKFLGKCKKTKWDASWKVGGTKLFLTSAYKKGAKSFDKDNLGLNHIAFGVAGLMELRKMAKELTAAKINHSGISHDQYSKKSFLWFDDPDKIRLE
jgi:catechol-2,3-dioxygenase